LAPGRKCTDRTGALIGTASAYMPTMRFIVATSYFAGLGFALRLMDEGHEVIVGYRGIDDRRGAESYDLVGNGLVRKEPLRDLITARKSYRDAYWIWDENHSVEENELLRAEGYRVLGGGRYADSMEHDREACLNLVARYGLTPPPSFAFDDPTTAIAFLEQHLDAAYVYKPDRGENHETWLPQSEAPNEANLELQQHLRSLRNPSPFVLQERKDGIETDVEVWFVNGEPRFAFMTIESKRRLAGDLGDLVGCAFDFVFVIPLDSRAVRESVGRLHGAYAEMRYTGFGDANFIAARDGVWFFEKCERFGYNSHPNLLWNLNRDPLGQTFAAIVDGTFEPNFSPGFGASCTMYMDHRASGKVIQFPESIARDLYFYDVYKESDVLLTAGYYDDVLVATAFGYTIPTAWEAVRVNAEAVKFPGRSFRIDGGATNYPSSPLRRYEALQAMGYL
jgi:phosphoribosylamine-glycine ligase